MDKLFQDAAHLDITVLVSTEIRERIFKALLRRRRASPLLIPGSIACGGTTIGDGTRRRDFRRGCLERHLQPETPAPPGGISVAVPRPPRLPRTVQHPDPGQYRYRRTGHSRHFPATPALTSRLCGVCRWNFRRADRRNERGRATSCTAGLMAVVAANAWGRRRGLSIRCCIPSPPARLGTPWARRVRPTIPSRA